MDLSGLGLIVGTAAVGLIGWGGKQALAIAHDWLLRWRLESAVGREVGRILLSDEFQQFGRDALGDLIEVGAKRLEGWYPDTLATLGFPPGRLEEMLRGAVGEAFGPIVAPATVVATLSETKAA